MIVKCQMFTKNLNVRYNNEDYVVLVIVKNMLFVIKYL